MPNKQENASTRGILLTGNRCGGWDALLQLQFFLLRSQMATCEKASKSSPQDFIALEVFLNPRINVGFFYLSVSLIGDLIFI